jgi:hypothetical protein
MKQCVSGAIRGGAANAADPLASWNRGPAKQVILVFVNAAMYKNTYKYVSPAEFIVTL